MLSADVIRYGRPPPRDPRVRIGAGGPDLARVGSQVQPGGRKHPPQAMDPRRLCRPLDSMAQWQAPWQKVSVF